MNNADEKPLLSVVNLHKYFSVGAGALLRKKETVRALNGVSLEINAGEAFCVVGESGCGKSTLARVVIGLNAPSSGEVHFDGDRVDSLTTKDRRPYRRRMQMIFQNPYASLNPRMTVGETLSEALSFHFPKLSAAESQDQVLQAMRETGLADEWHSRYPYQFSGGQRQRISIARALIIKPDFLIADEPIAALDVSIQAQILNLMIDLQEARRLAYLFITHDLSVVEHFGKRVAVMYLGTICEQANCSDLFARPRHPYTKILLDAVPRVKGKKMINFRSQGEVPTPINLPKGCVFHSRCPHASERCKREIPALKKVGESIVACHAVAEGRI